MPAVERHGSLMPGLIAIMQPGKVVVVLAVQRARQLLGLFGCGHVHGKPNDYGFCPVTSSNTIQ